MPEPAQARESAVRLNVTRNEYRDPPWVTSAESIIASYGVACPTAAETRARVGVLDRMGALSADERRILRGAGWL